MPDPMHFIMNANLFYNFPFPGGVQKAVRRTVIIRPNAGIVAGFSSESQWGSLRPSGHSSEKHERRPLSLFNYIPPSYPPRSETHKSSPLKYF